MNIIKNFIKQYTNYLLFAFFVILLVIFIIFYVDYKVGKIILEDSAARVEIQRIHTNQEVIVQWIMKHQEAATSTLINDKK